MAVAADCSHQVDSYIKERGVEDAVAEVVQALLEAKPENPRRWLLDRLEQELSEESDDLLESDLHRLFAASRKITAEIVPQETIGIVISETVQLLSCDTVSLFVLDKKASVLRLYASNLSTPIVVNMGQGIAGYVFEHLETVNIPDCYKDPRFDSSFDKVSGYYTRSLLAAPILDYEGSCVGVLQAINKMGLDGKSSFDHTPVGMQAVPFRRNDEKILLHLTQHVGIALRNAEVYREAISSSERATGLLNTVQSLSQDLGIQSMLLTITMHAGQIVSCERSTVFLLDEAKGELWSVSTDTGQEIRIPKTTGLAGECCSKGELINIPDAYADKRFNQEVDKRTGFKTQNILAVPMFTADGCVSGVIQMINKVSPDGSYEVFDDADVEVMELFAKFVGPKLTQSSMFVKDSHRPALEADLALSPSKLAAPVSPEPRRSVGRTEAMGALLEDEEDEGR